MAYGFNNDKSIANLKDLIIRRTFQSENVNIPANGGTGITVEAAVPGYTPLAITRLQNNRGSLVIANGYYWSGGNLVAYNKNTANTQQTGVYVIVDIVYIRSDCITIG